MYQEERIYQILQLLKNRKTLSNREIMDSLKVSRDTARRDIIRLVAEGGAIRTHGGIAVPSFSDEIQEYRVRIDMNSEEKAAIGEYASGRLEDGRLYFFDASTTVLQMCRALDKPVNCYTNSLDNLSILMEKGGDIHLLGGKVNPKNRFIYGNEAITIIDELYFDVAFLGVAAIHEDGFYVADQEDAFIKKHVARRAKAVWMLADHQKFSNHGRYRALSFAEADGLITDREVPELLECRMRDAGVKVEIM